MGTILSWNPPPRQWELARTSCFLGIPLTDPFPLPKPLQHLPLGHAARGTLEVTRKFKVPALKELIISQQGDIWEMVNRLDR